MSKQLRTFLIIIMALSFTASTGAMPILAYSYPQVSTNSASSVQNTSALLNGNLYDFGGYYNVSTWFQWGTTQSYGNETSHQVQSSLGNFSQQIYNLNPNTTYHFRVVAESQYGITYGNDMTFLTGQYGNQQITVNAGQDLYVSPGQSVILQGSGYDSSGNQINYSWNCSGGSLSSYNIAQPLFTAPYNYSQATYNCTLTVTNNYGQSNSDTAIVNVNYNNSGTLNVYTNTATNISGNSAYLNGYVSNSVYGGSIYTWFQWGTTQSYGNETSHKYIDGSGSFSQNLNNLSYNTIYHYRAAAQLSSGNVVYGNDLTFYTGQGGYNNTGTMLVDKNVINFSSGNLNWSSYVSASPSDVLAFAITIRAGSQDLHNVFIKDTMPANLVYQNNFTVAGSSNYTGNDITSGITINTIPAGQIVIIGYQSQVSGNQNFNYGTVALNNSVTVTSNESGTQTDSATISVTKSETAGATTIPTGTTNKFLTDSFFLPMAMIFFMSWLYFTGRIYMFADWLKEKMESY